MLSLYFLAIFTSGLSVNVMMINAGLVLLEKASGRCNSRLKEPHDGHHVTIQMPPNISGHWVSSSCEVRPGPEFLTRSYRFFSNYTFQALQFYYQDSHCSQPSYTLLIQGRVHPLQASWVTRGGTECEYHLSRVQLLCYGPQLLSSIQRRLETCDLPRPLRAGLTYELWDERWVALSRDCTRGLDFSMQELQLMRLERHYHHGDPSRQVEELFLGDVHTERARRRLHRPSGYQNPLQSAKRNRPVHLHGNWVSTRCEVRPGILFLTRYLTFYENSNTWKGQYDHFSDPVCRHPTFSITASGHYSKGDSSSTIMDAVEFTFTVTHMNVTPMDAATTSLLNVFSGHECGAEGLWKQAVSQDVTSTAGCAALGIRLPHTEYELFSMGQDSDGHSLLYNGQRPTNGSSPDRPHRRATSFQPPLIRCIAGQKGESDVGRGDKHFRLGNGCNAQNLRGLFNISILVLSVIII